MAIKVSVRVSEIDDNTGGEVYLDQHNLQLSKSVIEALRNHSGLHQDDYLSRVLEEDDLMESAKETILEYIEDLDAGR